MVTAATRPVQDWYSQQNNALRSEAAQMGQLYGTPRFDMGARLTSDAATKIGDISSSLYGNAYQFGQQMDFNRQQGQSNALLNLINSTKGVVTQPQYAPSPLAQAIGPLATVAGYALGGPMGGAIGGALGGMLGGGGASATPSPQGLAAYPYLAQGYGQASSYYPIAG
jgi:hypothetical protein